MRFIDEAEILVQAGHGGPGAVSFRREKFVPMGGPDGGEGGSGGNILISADSNLGTLMDFRYRRKFLAPDGMPGQGGRCAGRDGNDILLKVPVGTVVRDRETNEIIFDFKEATNEPLVLCKGGRGGKGNSHFKSATHQAPRFAQPGEDGERRVLHLELKLLADVAIVGLPNAGKSSLIASISAAKPKIADYPFTTLVPNLGVVKLGEGKAFVVADVPGLIAGASEGVGLGHRFLRHVERSRLIVHLIDVSDGNDPKEAYTVIRRELTAFSDDLEQRPELIVFNKIDAQQDSTQLDAFIEALEADATSSPWTKISVATGEGVEALIWKIWSSLQTIRQEAQLQEPESSSASATF